MSSSITKEKPQEALQLKVAVRPLSRTASTPRASAPRKDKAMAIMSLIALGYPIGRYLQQIEADNDYAGGMVRIYSRMRTVYYQNKHEFESLGALLKNRLEGVGSPVLSAMARQADGFVPMWLSTAQAQPLLKFLKTWA